MVCAWRATHKLFIQKHYTSDAMTYADVIAMSKMIMPYTFVAEDQGGTLPKSQRQRNMLNIAAAHMESQPLVRTSTIMDVQRVMTRNGMRSDGLMPTRLSNSTFFSLRDADTIAVAEVAKLMGHDIDSLDLDNILETQFSHMLGMSVHLAVAGSIQIALIATLGAE